MRWNPALQGLRGLAVSLVLLYHVHRGVLTGAFGVEWVTEGPLFDLAELGRLGVDLFFLLSGYLIVGSLARHGDVGRFLVGRARRIYPAFLVPHLIVFGLGPLVGYAWMAGLSPLEYVGHFLSNLLFLPGVLPLPIAQIVAWSLSYEFAFYVLAASAWAIGGRERSGVVSVIAWTAWVTVAATLLAYHPRGWFLVAGVVVYRAEAAGLGERLVRHSLAPWIARAALLVTFATFEVAFPVAVLAGGLFLFLLVHGCPPLGGLLARRELQYLGAVSYSLYLWHSMVLFLTKRVFVVGRVIGDPTWNLVAYAIASVALSVVAAHVSYVVVEKWFTQRFLVPRRVPEPVPLPAATLEVGRSRQAA